MKNINNTLNGYMTLEAALLMPIVWFTLFFVLFAGFFQYDRCIAEQDGKLITIRAVEMREKEEAKVLQSVMGKEELAGGKKLLFSHFIKKELHMSDDKAKIEISGQINTVLSGLLEESGLSVFSYTAKYEAEQYDPTGFIRMCRRVKTYAGS